MGEGLNKMFEENRFSDWAEEEEDLGEDSDSGEETDEPCLLLSSPSSCLDPNSPAYDFSSLIDQLPVKRGLSEHYQGKSQSYTSLSEVKSVKDLPKKERELPPSTRKMKPCKSYAGLDVDEMTAALCCKSITKKAPPSMTSCASSMARNGNGGFLSRGSCPPPIPVSKRQ